MWISACFLTFSKSLINTVQLRNNINGVILFLHLQANHLIRLDYSDLIFFQQQFIFMVAVHFRHKEVTVYPDESSKPPLGEGLNRPAQVTLDRVWPMDRKAGTLISDPFQLDEIDYEGTLRNACCKMNARFKEYRPQTGSWVFKVSPVYYYLLVFTVYSRNHIGTKERKL